MSMTHQNDSASRVIDAETRRVLVEEVAGAKSRGWIQDDIRRWFSSKGVTLPQYKSAVNGESVPDSVAASLAQISITGLPLRAKQPNREDIKRHIEWLIEPALADYGDALFEIAHTDGVYWNAKLFDLDEVSEAVSFAAEKNEQGRNVYIAAALRLPDADRSKRSSAADFYVATAVPIDIDTDYDATRARMAAVCEDGCVVTTGLTPDRRSQHWTRLVDPCDDEGDFSHAFAAVVMHTGADLKVKDSARIMRLGGTVSYPDERKRAKGYLTELTTVSVRADARRTDIERLKGLEPAAVPLDGFTGDRAAGAANEIETDWTGRVTDGRESFFRDLLLKHVRRFQEETGADPEVQELFDAAYAEFSNPAKVDNKDGRWTCGEGQKQLMHRVENTMRRLRSGRLSRVGLYSIDTEAGREEAERIAANRKADLEARKKPTESFVAEVASEEGTAIVTRPVTASSEAVGLTIFDPWERYSVPRFPMDVLPQALRDFVEYQAVSTGADPAAIAMAALATCSGALSQEFALKMKRTGDWYVKPRLWVMLVGDPSSKKSPVMSACVKPIRAWEGVGVKDYQKSYGRWKEDREAQKTDPEPTKPTRYLLNEVTPEKLGEILSRQDRGILVEQDEISGWIGAMEKYAGGKGAAADRGFWLGAYNGGPRTIDRLGRGETFVQNLCVSFVGGVQPDRLKELGNLTSDGLLQRFLPVMMKRSVYSEEVENDEPAKAYEQLIYGLLRLSPAKMQMDEGGRDAATSFQRFVHDAEGMEGLGKGFCGFVGKLSGIHGSLALTLHLASDPDAVFENIPERTVRDAERILREFCIPHAMELYRGTTDGGDWEAMRKVASLVLTSDKDRFTVSDFMSGIRSLRGLTVWEIGQKISPLVAGGWLQEDDDKSPGRAWIVPQGLREVMAERREIETKRKAEAMEMIRKARIVDEG